MLTISENKSNKFASATVKCWCRRYLAMYGILIHPFVSLVSNPVWNNKFISLDQFYHLCNIDFNNRKIPLKSHELFSRVAFLLEVFFLSSWFNKAYSIVFNLFHQNVLRLTVATLAIFRPWCWSRDDPENILLQICACRITDNILWILINDSKMI